MNHKKSIAYSLVFLILALALISCARPLLSPALDLYYHPKRTVRYPAKAGAISAGIISAPVWILMLPYTFVYLEISDAPSEVYGGVLASPCIFFSDLGTVLVGGPPWLVFGWWGNDEEYQESDEDAMWEY